MLQTPVYVVIGCVGAVGYAVAINHSGHKLNGVVAHIVVVVVAFELVELRARYAVDYHSIGTCLATLVDKGEQEGVPQVGFAR